LFAVRLIKAIAAMVTAPFDDNDPAAVINDQSFREVCKLNAAPANLLLSAAELINDPGNAPDGPDDKLMAEAYNYVPFSVLGDYHFDVEPNWLKLPQMAPEVFLVGLRQRNWTCPDYKYVT